MLRSTWRELEELSARIDDLEGRRSAAQSSRNIGLVTMLSEEIVRFERLRERLVSYMSRRLIGGPG
jgi:hypothetical protein